MKTSQRLASRSSELTLWQVAEKPLHNCSVIHLPTATGMAFVLIQHLAPYQKSLLTEILVKTTIMPVSEAQNDTIVQPNQVYIIPPNAKMTLVDGKLHLMPREKVRGTYLPVDAFFVSLSLDRVHKAIAVMLSGGDVMQSELMRLRRRAE